MTSEGITQTALTQNRLAAELRQLGVQQGMTLLVHSSLRNIGWVDGGPASVIAALMDVVTDTGTLVMPTHSANYSDPANWHNPAVPEALWPTLYEAMPAFHPNTTPSYQMGTIAETFRTTPGVMRSTHPQVSFAAWGRNTQHIIGGQTLAYGLGENSPLARIYDLNGWILLLGVGYDRNTSFHLAEYRVPNPIPTTLGSPIYERGERVWKHFPDIEYNAEPFATIGETMEQNYLIKIGKIGSADSRLLPQRLAVDFAIQWLSHRPPQS